MSKSITLLASLVAILAAGAIPANGQSLLKSQGQILAVNGDLVPGTAMGEAFGGTSTFDTGVMDNAGGVFFRGRFVNGTASGTTDRALFYGTSRSDLTMVLRSGDPEPSGTVPGATLNTASGTGIGGSNRISGNGFMLFGASLNDLGVSVTSSNDTCLYVGNPGGFAMLVREGDPAIGTTGATYSSSFSSPSQQQTGLNDSLQVFFKSALTGGDVVGTTNNEGLYSGTPGGLVLVARKGDLVLPAGEQILALTPAFVSQLNSLGQVLYDVSYVVGSGMTPVTAADDRALWIYTPGVGSQLIVREGDASVIPGVTYNNASNSWSVNTGSTTFNVAGEVLLRCDLAGAVTAGVDDSAIVKFSVGSQSLVARRGDAAPGIAGAFLDVFSNASLQLADSGNVAFQSSLTGTVTTADDTAIFAGTPGGLFLVAREGDVAPGTGGATFGSVSGQSMMMNGAGQLLFNNTLVGGTFPGSALFSWDPILGLRPVVLNGESIEIQPMVFAGSTSSGGIQFTNGDSRPLTFANDGTLTLRVSFPSSVSAIAKVRLGSLTGLPPKISVSAGGVQALYLDGGYANAVHPYAILGTASGTNPGFTFGNFLIPLNQDFVFNYTLSFPNVPPLINTLGFTNSTGRATAAILVPAGSSPAFVGVVFDWCGVIVDNALNVVFVSETASLEMIP